MFTYQMKEKAPLEFKLDRYKGALYNYNTAKEAYKYARQHLQNTKRVLASELQSCVQKQNKTCVVNGVVLSYESYRAFNSDSIQLLKKKYSDVYESLCVDDIKIKLENRNG